MLWIDYAYDVQRAVRDARRRSATEPAPDGGRSATTRVFRDEVAGFYVDAQALLTWATAASRSSCAASRRPSTRC